MADTYLRIDMARVTLDVDGLPVVFDRMIGGVFVDPGDYTPITLGKLWGAPDGTLKLLRLTRAVGRAVKVRLQPLDFDGADIGDPVGWLGTLVRVGVRPMVGGYGEWCWHDSNQDAPAVIVAQIEP